MKLTKESGYAQEWWCPRCEHIDLFDKLEGVTIDGQIKKTD